MAVGTTMPGTLFTSTAPTRSDASVTRRACTTPLAVCVWTTWPALVSRPMRSASIWLSATSVAPVSTMNCTLRPLMLPSVTKWPPLLAGITISRPPPPPGPPASRAGAPPTRSSRC